MIRMLVEVFLTLVGAGGGTLAVVGVYRLGEVRGAQSGKPHLLASHGRAVACMDLIAIGVFVAIFAALFLSGLK